jgi:hypothetical protein
MDFRILHSKRYQYMGFSVQIIAKPYVKRFIENTCGNPADLSKFPDLKDLFRRYLKKPNTRFDKTYDNELRGYTQTIDIVISEDDFYRCGWEVSRTDMIDFGREVERKAKFLMRNYVSLYFASRVPIKTAINRFQDMFGFTEEDWSYEAIKKDFYRNGHHNDIVRTDEIKKLTRSNILSIIDKIFLENLSHSLGQFNNVKLQA